MQKLFYFLNNIFDMPPVLDIINSSITFLDALTEERYHLTTSTILSLGSLRSAALKNQHIM